MSAAARMAALDRTDPEPTADELAAAIGPGVEVRYPHPGERCGAEELDVVRYWPDVPPELDARPRRPQLRVR